MPKPDIRDLPPHVQAALTAPTTPKPTANGETPDQRVARLEKLLSQRYQDACHEWHQHNSWMAMPDHIAHDIAGRIHTQLLNEIRTGQHD